jgi:hypothetical protein
MLMQRKTTLLEVLLTKEACFMEQTLLIFVAEYASTTLISVKVERMQQSMVKDHTLQETPAIATVTQKLPNPVKGICSEPKYLWESLPKEVLIIEGHQKYLERATSCMMPV